MKNKRIIILSFIALILIVTSLSFSFLTNEEEIEEIALVEETKVTEVVDETFKVDIKGAVVNPGVYTVSSNSIVQDLIDQAGGLTKNAYTKNINLSKKLQNEMVIYIFTTSEIKKLEVQNDVVCKTEVIEITNSGDVNKTTNTQNKITGKININTASLNELTNVPGVGESKAQAIIEYRNQKKFTSIEEIKEVSGIGDSLYAKIQEYITV